MYDDDYDDYFEDTDSVPDELVTCFNPSDLTLYRQAIDEYSTTVNSQHSLDIDTSGEYNGRKDPALLCFQRGDLSKFWRIFDRLKDERVTKI